MPNNPILIAYVPVLHSGYIKLFREYPHDLYLIGDSMIREIAIDQPYYGRDIRALDTTTMNAAIMALNILPSVNELTPVIAKELALNKSLQLIAPDEDITDEIVSRYFSNHKMDIKNIFLRWDKKITEKEYEISPDRKVSRDSNDISFVSMAKIAADQSSDWWRQVGAVLVKDGEVLFSGHNRHMPDAHSPYALGDPRNNYDVGQGPHYYTSIHAEAGVIASAAREGISLKGSAIYASTFPCPTCARLIKHAGINSVYYSQGYSALDAESILKEADIEIIYVPLQ